MTQSPLHILPTARWSHVWTSPLSHLTSLTNYKEQKRIHRCRNMLTSVPKETAGSWWDHTGVVDVKVQGGSRGSLPGNLIIWWVFKNMMQLKRGDELHSLLLGKSVSVVQMAIWPRPACISSGVPPKPHSTAPRPIVRVHITRGLPSQWRQSAFLIICRLGGEQTYKCDKVYLWFQMMYLFTKFCTVRKSHRPVTITQLPEHCSIKCNISALFIQFYIE